MREGLIFERRRSPRGFFNGLLDGNNKIKVVMLMVAASGMTPISSSKPGPLFPEFRRINEKGPALHRARPSQAVWSILPGAPGMSIIGIAAGSPGPVFSFVDPEVAAPEEGTVQGLNGGKSAVVVHLHESKSAQAARLAIGDEAYGQHLAVSAEQVADFIVIGRKGKVADVNFFGHVESS